MSMPVTAPGVVLGWVSILALLFLAVRRVWWWYWGIDRAISALEDIAESLRTLPSVRSYDVQPKRPPARAA